MRAMHDESAGQRAYANNSTKLSGLVAAQTW